MPDSSAPSGMHKAQDTANPADAAKGTGSVSAASSAPLPPVLLLLAALFGIELAVLVPAIAYRLVVWTSYLDDKHISPYIFSWLSLALLAFALVRTLQYIFTRNPKGFAFCQLCLMLHMAAAFIGAGSGLFLHVMHGETPLFYQLMGGMGVAAVIFLFANRVFKNSASLRNFFAQPPLEG